MTPLTLLDVDQMAPADRDTLGHILGCYGGVMIALYSDGAMHCLVPIGLECAFLATVARDASPVEIIAVPVSRAA